MLTELYDATYSLSPQRESGIGLVLSDLEEAIVRASGDIEDFLMGLENDN